jgi:hypothetical protein
LSSTPRVVGKAFDQLVFEAGFAVAVLEVGGRAVTGNDPQYPILLYALQSAGFFNAGTEHQEESGCEEPFGAARADMQLEKTSAQYTQSSAGAISRQFSVILILTAKIAETLVEWGVDRSLKIINNHAPSG